MIPQQVEREVEVVAGSPVEAGECLYQSLPDRDHSLGLFPSAPLKAELEACRVERQ